MSAETGDPLGSPAASKSAGALRQRAEQMLRKLGRTPRAPELADISNLLQELSIHQVELELQGDELRATLDHLTRSRELYFQHFKSAPIPIVRFSADGAALEFNLAARELIMRADSDSPAARQREFEARMRLGNSTHWHRALGLCTGEGRTVNARIALHGDGDDWRTYSVSLHPIRGQEATEVLAYFIDITAEEARREEQKRLALVAEHSLDLVVITDAQRQVEWVNPAFTVLTGYTFDEVKGRNLSLLQGHGTCKETVLRMRNALNHGRGFHEEILNYSKSGRAYWIDIRVTPRRDEHGRINGFMAVERDISDRKRAEEALLRKDRLLLGESRVAQRLLQGGPLETVLADVLLEVCGAIGADQACLIEDRPADGNPKRAGSVRCIRMSGEAAFPTFGSREDVGLDSLFPVTLSEFIRLPERAAPILHGELELLSSGSARQGLASPVNVDGGVWGILAALWNSSQLIDDASIGSFLISISASVGSFVRAQLAQEETRRLVTAIEQSRDSVVITDATGCILYVNSGFEAASGYSRAEALGGNPRVLKSGEHPPEFYQRMWRELSEGRVWEGRITNRRKGGQLYIEDVSISPIRDDKGAITHYVAVKRDITHEIEQERRLRQSERLESIGRLAGGIAHDFNNMLAVIMGNVGVLTLGRPRNDPILRHLEEIRKAADRSAALTRQLLAYARRQQLDPQRINLNTAIDGMLGMLRRLIGEEIVLKFDRAADLRDAILDPSQLDQIMVNLVVNARDAIDGHGSIRITTANVTLAAAKGDLPPGGYIRLSVEDNGCGMSRETLAHIFDPFFTTKGIGRGTGLGLATVAGIVAQSGGHIDVESRENEGTRFDILLPAERSPVPDPPPAQPPASTGPSHATLLLVEDEPSILEVTGQILRQHGFHVVCASAPDEAIRTVAEQGLKADLLITDVIMPGMNGRELFERLRTLLPDLKCLYMSGYTSDILASKGIDNQAVSFVPKPFTMQQILDKVGLLLARAPGD